MNESVSAGHFMAGDVPLVFGGSPLDRADASRDDEKWMSERLGDSASRFVIYQGLKPLMRISPELDIAYVGGLAVASMLADGAVWVFLGLVGGCAHFALAAPDAATAEALQKGFEGKAKFIDVRSVAIQFDTAAIDNGRAGIIAQGRALLDWHARHGFCAKCGGLTEIKKAGYLRRCQDLDCAAEHFPRTDPVVIMLATRGENCLVGRQAGFPECVYSALAGFMEPGETIEDAVRREIMEEAGIQVGRVSYHASQPWPFPSTLMIGCYAEALSEDIHLDERELEDARWIDRKTLKAVLEGAPGAPYGVPTRMAIAHTLMHHWAFET